MDRQTARPAQIGPEGGVVLSFSAAARRDASRCADAGESAFRREVGCRVRVSRMSCRWTPKELARATGLPVATLRRLEDGMAPVDAWHLRLVAEALGVTVAALTGTRTWPS